MRKIYTIEDFPEIRAELDLHRAIMEKGYMAWINSMEGTDEEIRFRVAVFRAVVQKVECDLKEKIALSKEEQRLQS